MNKDKLRYEKMLIIGLVIKELELSNIITHTHKPYIELVDLALQLEQEWREWTVTNIVDKTFYEFVYDRLIEMENE